MLNKLRALMFQILGVPEAGSGRHSRRPPRYRPGIECLEGRLVPATLVVTTRANLVDPDDGKLSLREAVNRANATETPDLIVLQPGIYRIGLAGAAENDNATGDFDVTNPVTLLGHGASSTVIDGRKRDRLFDLIGNANGVFANLTLRNGAIPLQEESESLDGGAIQARTANLRLHGCVVSGNRAENGGGIYGESGNITLIDSNVSRNVAADQGGGIFLGGGTLRLRDSVVRRNLAGNDGGGIVAETVRVTNSTISGNSANDDGGGIDADTVSLTNSTVSGNSAEDAGGGIFASTATLTNSTVRGNGAVFDGGGIDADTVSLTNSTVSGNSAEDGGGIDADTVTLTHCTVSGNSADFVGGGIFANTATLTNTTVSGNSADDEGGGIYATSATLVNCTITENSAGDNGGGVFHDPGGLFNVKNTIIAQNLVGFDSETPDVSGDFVSQGHNLIGDPTGSTGFDSASDQVGSPANPLDPRLAPLALNGGPTRTHALLPGSRAIDRGDNSGAPATDQRGLGRPRDGDGNGSPVVDIGAFEW